MEELDAEFPLNGYSSRNNIDLHGKISSKNKSIRASSVSLKGANSKTDEYLPDIAKKLSKKNRESYKSYIKLNLQETAGSLEHLFNFSIPEIAGDILTLEALKSEFI